jgi:hypothetical protein
MVNDGYYMVNNNLVGAWAYPSENDDAMTRRRSHFLVTGENDEQFSVGKSYIWLVVSTYPIYGDSMV